MNGIWDRTLGFPITAQMQVSLEAIFWPVLEEVAGKMLKAVLWAE